MNSSLFFQTPQIVASLGEDLFCKFPLYKNINSYKPIYINKELYKKIFKNEKHYSWENMSRRLADVFSVTLVRQNDSAEQVGWAYVDKQADPMNLSLSGNLGSGRAFYCGEMFNIKGEKTPLAISENPFYSSGMLGMEKGIKETLIANSLHQDVNIRLAPILAILDSNEFCATFHMGQMVDIKSVKIIRIANQCLLERITHLFYLNTPLTKNKFIKSAIALGKLEANKFTERILHGAYSAGNISQYGDMIDLESAFSVRGRFPQYSITMKYPGNYFGFEYQGQLEILAEMAKNKDINVDNVPYAILEKKLLNSMKLNIAKEFLYLMGASHRSLILKKYKKQIFELSDMFNDLSRKALYSFKGMFLHEPLSLFVYFFDFSCFFRYYPLLKKEKCFNLEKGLALLCDKKIPFDEVCQFDNNVVDAEAVVFDDAFFSITDDISFLKKEVIKFITQYDDLYEKIAEHFNVDQNMLAARAYKINEQRIYLSAVFSLCYWLAQSEQLSYEAINILIETLIQSNKRKPLKKEGGYVADIHIYLEGYTFVLLDGKGEFQFCVSLFKNKLPIKKYISQQFELYFKNKKCTASVCSQHNIITLFSEKRPMGELLNNQTTALFRQWELEVYYQNEPILLSELLIVDEATLLNSTKS